MKKVTIRDELGYVFIANLLINDDWQITVEHQDGKVDVVIPERLAAEVQEQSARLEALLNSKKVVL